MNRKHFAYGAAALALAGAWQPAFAQEDVGAIQEDVGAIIVTARRVEERLQDVPISITVFNQQQLTNRNVVTASDLATYTPSLTANSRFGPESTSFAVRGFVQEGPTSPSVGTYFAEVVAPRANGGTTAGNGAGVGAFFDLANVQVLKGPQGTLFGRNTTGGAVLLVPQKPTARLEGYVEGSVGNYDLRRIQAVANVPVFDTLRVRIGVDHQTRDGYLRNLSSVGPRDFNDVDYTALRFSAVADLSPNIENYFVASYSVSDTNGSAARIFFLNPARENPAGAATHAANLAAVGDNFYDATIGNPLAHQNIKQWQVINNTTWHMSDTLTVKNIISYAEFRQKQTTNINGDDGFAVTPANPYYSIAVFTAPGSHNVAQSTFTEELQLQGRTTNDRLTYQLGGYLELSEPLDGFQTTYVPQTLNCTNVLAFQCTNLSGRGQLQISSSQYHFRNLGVYGQATYKVSDTISVTGGLRYTSDVTSGSGRTRRLLFPSTPGGAPAYACASPANLVQGPIPSNAAAASAAIQADPDLCRLNRRVASSKPTWLAGLDWKPNDDLLIYAKYARGYRQGSVNVAGYGLETWRPEKVDLYEVGAKTSFDSFVKGTFNIAAFYNNFSDQQLLIGLLGCSPAQLGSAQCPFIAPSGRGIANAGKSIIKGVEIDASVRPFEGFNLDVRYAHLDTKLERLAVLPPIPLGFSTLTLPIVGGPLTETPRNKYSVTGSYTLPVDHNIGRITFSATFTHQDSVLGNVSSSPQNQRVPSQNLLNLNFSWNSIAGAPIDLAVFATNITKEKFFLYTTADSFGNDAYIANQPRMYGARLKYRFGN